MAVSLACGSGSEGELGFSRLGDDVEWEGWVDAARPLAGDGATSFDSFPRQRAGEEYPLQLWMPNFLEEEGFDAGPLTGVVGEHLLSLSRFRGLVSARVTGPDAPRVDASLPLDGLPVGLILSDGVAAVIVVDLQKPGCVLGDCIAQQTSRVVLVDVADPANPLRLGEQRIRGTVSAARQVGGVLHVLSRDVVRCAQCEAVPRLDHTWFAFDRNSPRELGAPRQTPLSRDAFFLDDRLIDLALTELATKSVLRVADLSGPEPTLSAPITLAAPVRQAHATGDRLILTYERSELDVETFALETGSPVSLGRGTVALPGDEPFGRITFDGERAVTMLEASRRLAALDLSVAGAPALASLLDVGLAEAELAIEGGRVLAAGRSTLAADAPPADEFAHGPQALVLVDVEDLAAPRVLDRATLGSFDSQREGSPVLSGGRALFRYYEAFPGAIDPSGATCGRSLLRLVGYDLASDTLAPAFAFDGIDAGASVETVGDEWWLASNVALSRYRPSASAAPIARVELTRWVDELQPLGAGVALFGLDFASNAPTLELASPGSELPLDVSAAAGLARFGCDERRRWSSPALERDGNLYALRSHRPADSSPALGTLHVVAASSPSVTPTPSRALELEPLAEGEVYLGSLRSERALLIARGAGAEGSASVSDPTRIRDPFSADLPWRADLGDSAWVAGSGDDRGAVASRAYDIIDLGDPAAPTLAARLDIEPALAAGGFFRDIRGVTRDTAGGFQGDSSKLGPAIISGSILAGSHAERSGGGPFRFYLDRFDLSEPSTPVALAPIEIPGSLLGFDAATGELISLEALRLDEAEAAPDCDTARRARGAEPWVCGVQRRALAGLVVDGDRATRVGRVVLDTDEREAVRFAVSAGTVYYVTQPAALPIVAEGPFAARDITLQRVAWRDGRLERLPSFDVAASSNLSPKLWTQFAARGHRALWVAGAQLLVADFSGDEPRLEVHELGAGGCEALALRDDTAYCAQGQAGYATIPLGAP